jgi:hypothetical protein
LVFKGFVDFLRNKMNYKGWSITNVKYKSLALVFAFTRSDESFNSAVFPLFLAHEKFCINHIVFL